MAMIVNNARGVMTETSNRGTTTHGTYSNLNGATPAATSTSSSVSFTATSAGTKPTSHRASSSTLGRAATTGNTMPAGSDPSKRLSTSNHFYPSSDRPSHSHHHHMSDSHQNRRSSFSTKPEHLKASYRNLVNSHSQSQSHTHIHSYSSTRGGDSDIRHGSVTLSGPPLPTSSYTADISAADANFKAGMKLIQQAYKDRYHALEDETARWKQVAEEQSVQMAAMATELARVQESFNALQKEMSQLETFRKAIVSMVDQHSGVSLTELEQSILETIEADTDNVDTGYDPVADADTSSFMLDGEVESSFSSYMPKNVKVSSGSKSANVNSSFAANARPRAATAAVEGYSNASSLNNGGTSASTLEQSPNNDRKLLKFGSAESLRLKRNTISSSARPVYQHNNVSKRHSSISPLSPKSRQIVSSSKVPAGSASFSNSSSPSTSPREPSKPMGAFSSRTARQHQQQKEYSLSVRNTMSQLAGLSTGGSGSTSTSRRPQPMETVSLVQNSTSSPGSSDSAKRTRRSESGVMPTTHPSPAAKEHLKQQERLQEQERSALKGRALALSPHSIQTTRTPGDHDKQSSYSQLQIAPSTIQNQSKNGTSVRNLKDERRYASDTAESMKGSQRTASAQERRKQPYQREGASISGQNGGGGVDANAFTLLYKEIRDSMDSTSFGLFARVVTAFNEGEKSTDETLQEVSRIVKDRALNQRFKNLIEQAIAEKENQMEKAGNETMEGDLTLEIDHSLLMDPVEEEEEEELLLGEGVNISDQTTGSQEGECGSRNGFSTDGTHPKEDYSSDVDRDHEESLPHGYQGQDKQNKTLGDATEIGTSSVAARKQTI